MTTLNKIVYLETFNGRLAPKKETRSIKGIYYHKDDLILHEGRYNRINNGKITYDLDTKKWVSSKEIVNNKYIFATDGAMVVASKNPNSVNAHTQLGLKRVHSDEMAIACGARYSAGFQDYSYKKKSHNNKFPFNLSYSYNPGQQYQKDILLSHTPWRNVFGPETSEFLTRILKRYSIGAEIETANGNFSKLDLHESKMIPLRDGSIENVEMVSSPMRDLEAINRFKRFFDFPYGISQKGSIHFHVGGAKVTKETGLSIYYLCTRIQDELHNCIPSYKRSHGFLRGKEKDHAQKLNGFNMEYSATVTEGEHFKKLWRFLCGGHVVDYGTPHPMEGRNKWEWNMRYYYINMLPFFFSPYKTVEFRLFPPTNDFHLSFIWMLLSIAIVEVAEDYKEIVFNNREKFNLRAVIDKSSFPLHIKEILSTYCTLTSDATYESVISGRNSFNNYQHEYAKLVDSMAVPLGKLYGK
jgi:hypothetical protein